MTTAISSAIGSGSYRRKRSRNEFETSPENIDNSTAIGNCMDMDQPRKRMRHSFQATKQINNDNDNKYNREHKEEEEILITTMNQIDIKKNLIHSNDKMKINISRKRSRIDFGSNYEENKILLQLSPNKRIRAQQQRDDRMNVDVDESDEEEDVSMQSKKKEKKKTESILVSRPNKHKQQKLRLAFPPNRVNRSGSEFCVLCGIGA